MVGPPVNQNTNEFFLRTIGSPGTKNLHGGLFDHLVSIHFPTAVHASVYIPAFGLEPVFSGANMIYNSFSGWTPSNTRHVVALAVPQFASNTDPLNIFPGGSPLFLYDLAVPIDKVDTVTNQFLQHPKKFGPKLTTLTIGTRTTTLYVGTQLFAPDSGPGQGTKTFDGRQQVFGAQYITLRPSYPQFKNRFTPHDGKIATFKGIGTSFTPANGTLDNEGYFTILCGGGFAGGVNAANPAQVILPVEIGSPNVGNPLASAITFTLPLNGFWFEQSDIDTLPDGRTPKKIFNVQQRPFPFPIDGVLLAPGDHG